jgi:long-chain acyl-CoA synthetase
MAITHVRGRKPVHVTERENLTTRLWERAKRSDSREILRYPVEGAWRGLTWQHVGDRVRDIAGGLLALGVRKGDRVALMSSTRLEWTLTDLAILAAGGVTVPIYETSSADQCAWILKDSGAKLAIAETADHAKSLDQANGEIGNTVKEIFVIDDGGLDAIAERGDQTQRDKVEERAGQVTMADNASIIYTSGTTGNPKGCVITHGNLLWTARQTESQLKEMFGHDDCTILFLPLAHSFARIIQFGVLESDVTLGYARSIETLQEDIQSFSPTFLLSVPRVFEKVYNGAQRKAGGGAKAKIFQFASDTGQAWSQAKAEGREPGIGANFKHGLADKLVYSKLRDALGGRVQYCVSGGAPLAPHLAHFFHAAGITILEGYGLTETSAPATANTPKNFRIGTVGQPLPGVEIKIADDGEILISGGNVFEGYYKNDKATNDVFTDENGQRWFHSGDIGELDDDGYLKITGRKKELIVTAGGKNVAPAVLEERLKAHKLVSQAMVVGDNRPFIGALITIDPEELEAFAAEQDIDVAEARDSEALQAEINKAVAHANAAVSKAESIRKVVVLERDFTQDDGEITPTMKVKRNVVAEHFSDEIEQLYTK